MAKFDTNRGGIYNGRFGPYEISIRDNPMMMGREILIRHPDGFCVGTRADHDDLYRNRMHGDPMVYMVEMAVENFERQYEERRHKEMASSVMSMSDMMGDPLAPTRPAAVQQQAREAEMRIRSLAEQRGKWHWEEQRKKEEAMRYALNPTPVKEKPKKGMTGDLRARLQAETDEWLKEVRQAG